MPECTEAYSRGIELGLWFILDNFFKHWKNYKASEIHVSHILPYFTFMTKLSKERCYKCNWNVKTHNWTILVYYFKDPELIWWSTNCIAVDELHIFCLNENMFYSHITS